MGLDNLPSAAWEVNRGWMLAANLACDLDAWVRLPALHDVDDLADAEPDTMRFRLYHLPARLADHARRRWLRIDATWPWAKGFITCWETAHSSRGRNGRHRTVQTTFWAPLRPSGSAYKMIRQPRMVF